MAFVCLPKELATKLKDALRSRELDPFKIADLTSEQRRAIFSKYVGEADAKGINALYESKLLLKNQKQGFATWARQVTGMKEPAKRALIDKIERLEKVLTPSEQKVFLEDLVEQRLGLAITEAEGAKIMEISKDVRTKLDDLETDPTNRKKQIAYGNSILDMDDYISEAAPKPRGWEQWAMDIAGLPQTLQTTLDISFGGRQGWNSITTPEFWRAWANQFAKEGEAGYLFSDKALRDMHAEIIGSPYYDTAKKAGLRLTDLNTILSMREEGLQSTLGEQIPVFGKAIKASQRAYTGMANELRFRTFVKAMEAAKLAGEDVSPKSRFARDIAATVNDLTGSGNLGTGDKYKNIAPLLNQVFYSTRKILADAQILNPQKYLDPRISSTARKLRLRNVIGSVGVSAAILGLASAMGADVEVDPHSSEGLKIKIGNTRYDVSGGKTTMVTFLARMLWGAYSKSTTGKIVPLNTGKFGSQSKGDVAVRFFRNKLAPNASYVVDAMYGENAIGEKFDVLKSIVPRLHPMVMGDMINMMEDDTPTTQLFLTVLFNLLGVGTNTYSSDK